jgi:DNA sulfur modification protein DndD
MRTRLDAKLKDVYRSISYKAYTPELNADFELTLYDNTDGSGLPVAKSAGENQVLSLAFVTAVSELAREIRVERQQEGGAVDDGTFPIVVDAAFGSLDQNYRELVSRTLARMAPQLVVLVSKSQGLGQVMTELQPFINHAGVIVAHTTNTSTKSEEIELFGAAHSYIQPSAESNYAELRTIK